MQIKLDNIEKSFGKKNNKRIIFSELSLDIKNNDTIAIMGASGNGKSTLLNILMGFESIDSGRYIYNGVDVTNSHKALSEMREKCFGMIPQGHLLIDELTVRENIHMPFKFRGIQIDDQAIYDDAKILGIETLIDKPVRQLSLGERQRTSIIRASICRPQVLLADEPTSALDKATRNKFIEYCTMLNEDGCALVMVTHDPYIADKCSIVYNMENGTMNKIECTYS